MNSPTRTFRVALAAITLLAATTVYADFENGLSLFKAGKYVEAAAEFQAIVDQSPDYDYGYYILGLSFLKMNKPGDADKNFRKALELNPDKFEYHHGLANSLMSRRKFGEVVKVLNPAEGLATSNGTKYALYSLRGTALASSKKWDEAIDDLEKALAIKKSPTMQVQLGKAYFALGHSDKAVPVFREALRSNPNDAETQSLLAEGLIKMGKESRDAGTKKRYYDEAVTAAEKCRSLEPNKADAVNLVGKAALGARDYGRAEQSFRRVLELKPDHCYAMINLGKTYIATEKFSAAEKPLKEAAQCAPRQATIYESLGLIYQKYGSQAQKDSPQQAFANYDQALKYYDQAAAIKNTSFIQKAKDTINGNIEVIKQNMQADELEKAQQEALEAERKRIEEEKRKREEWEKRQRREG